MFKIISKKRYRHLCSEIDKLREVIACIEKEAFANHNCNEVFCRNCAHAIMKSNPCSYTIDCFCDLDRKCKDYVKKELTEGSNGE